MSMQHGYALNAIQEGMVFHHIYDPGSGIDIEQILIDFTQSPDLALFLHAWRIVLDHHDVLRLRLEVNDANQSHVLVPVEGFEMPVTNLGRAMSPGDWHAWLAEDRTQGFDLFRTAPIRLAHAPLGTGMRFVWTFHHILLDGRSFADVLCDVFDTYAALNEGRAVDNPSRPDRQPFLEWLSSLNNEASLDFWRQRLDGMTEPTTLVQVPQKEAAWESKELTLTENETQDLSATCNELGISLNVLVQAAWSILLARYTDHEDICFGATRAGRRGSPFPDTDKMLGVFINTIPVRVSLTGLTVRDLLTALNASQRDVRPHEHTSLNAIQQAIGWGSTALFETLLVFDRESLQGAMHRRRPALEDIGFSLREHPPYPVTLYAYAEPCIELKIHHRLDALDPAQAQRSLEHMRHLLGQLAFRPDQPVDALDVLTEPDYREMEHFNATDAKPSFVDIATAFRQQVTAHPERWALLAHDHRMTYAELGDLVTRMAEGLAGRGVGHGTVVGIGLERSFEAVASVLAVLRLGAAYLPLDPEYPARRLNLYVRDSGIRHIVTASSHRHLFDDAAVDLIDVQNLAGSATGSLPELNINPDDLAYMIYTSGSTGVPNGVMIEQHSVVNFFAGMDAVLRPAEAGRWLAVTSLSFDISVLELLWTLTRGFEVVLHGAQAPRQTASRVGFSLFHFAQGAHVSEENPYRLILEAARFADEAGFEAIWSPERHFHDFGAPYPNPSVISAAIAAITRRLHIRAGSVVLPLHDPLRVAEEWALVDQLSSGRIGLAIASGWHPNDFALARDNYENRKTAMYDFIETIRALWRGEPLARRNGIGDEVQVRTFPRPRQARLPLWITAAGNPETFAQAGRIGANVLTHMLGQSVLQIRDNICAYRAARREHGFDEGHVTIMLHTFIGEDDVATKEIVRKPMKAYLASAASLVGQYADSWSAYRRGSTTQVSASDIAGMDEDTREELYEFAFERFFETSSLLGSEEKCAALVEDLIEVGANEIACLIDFGIETDMVLEQLPFIQRLTQRINGVAAPETTRPDVVQDLRAFAPTHLQCTPSQARMLTLASNHPADFASLKHVMIGGEALPLDLCQAFHTRLSSGVRLTNMYGPTETTIWSTTADVPADASAVTIGVPIANTRCHLLDSRGRAVPIGRSGELHIAGDGLARGYHDRPDLNRHRFTERQIDPRGRPERMYATGDLVRLMDGALQYIGRRDFQMKLRGYRIEFGEIESVLRAMDGIQDAVVSTRDDAAGTQQLVAYVVLGAGIQFDPPTIQAFLRERLPEYMVPGVFSALPSLPQTPNGKVDRKALPDTTAAQPAEIATEPGSPHTGVAAPVEETEKVIQEIWQRLLGMPDIARDDNFFDVGGHSILAVKMQNELRKALGRKIPITDIFRFPTVGQLAKRVSEPS